MRVHRIDRGTLRAPVRTPEGYLAVPAALTRVGVFEYSDGTKTWREYKPAETAFDPATLASIAHKPVTNDHPAVLVNAANWLAFAKGHGSNDAAPEDTFVVATVIVQDAATIAAIERGELVEVSLGYEAEIDWTAGTTPDGESYDAIQRDIRINHIALGPAGWGRAGPEVALRLNGAGVQVRREAVSQQPPAAQQIPRADAHHPKERHTPMATIKVGGREIKLDAAEDPAAAQAAVEQMQKDAASPAQQKCAELGATVQTLAGQCAELCAMLGEEAGMAAPAEGAAPPAPDAVMNAVRAKRAKLAAEALHADARAVLGKDAKLDGKDVLAIQRETVAHAHPLLAKHLDALDAKALGGMFADAVTRAKAAPARNDALAAANAAAANPPPSTPGSTAGSGDEDPALRMARAREQQRIDSMKGGR